MDYGKFKEKWLAEQWVRGNRTYYRGARNNQELLEPVPFDANIGRQTTDNMIWFTQRFGYALRYVFEGDIDKEGDVLEYIKAPFKEYKLDKKDINTDHEFESRSFYGWVYPLTIDACDIFDFGAFRDVDLLGPLLIQHIPYFANHHPRSAGAELSEFLGNRDWAKELDPGPIRKFGLRRAQLLDLLRNYTSWDGISNVEYGVAAIGLFKERAPEIKTGEPIKIYLDKEEDNFIIRTE